MEHLQCIFRANIIIKRHYSGESPPVALSKTSVTKITIKAKYKQANKDTRQYDTIKY